jgi:hypothetical protein
LSRGVGERSVAGVDTEAFTDIPLSTSPSSIHSRHGGMDEPC